MSVDSSIENLKELVDKYEHPELFSLLDSYQLQFEFQKRVKGHHFPKDSFVVYRDGEKEEIGVVVRSGESEILINFYGEIRKVETKNPALVISDSRILPLDWLKCGVKDDFRRFKLKSLASYLYLAHTFDKMQSLSNSRTQILAHQIESTYRVISSITPRFLIADEVGLGKTIEAGLIIKEFMIRFHYNRVLVVVPASLQLQWQQEMREKFNEDFTVLDNRLFQKRKHQLPSKTIVSLDFAKQERVKKVLLQSPWDTVIFDEAHRLRRDSRVVTKAYHLADEISGKAKVFLLLSATPFSGKLEELFYLIRLLNPNLLGTYHNFTMDYVVGKKETLREKLEPVVIRRRKVDVGGFTRRLAKTISFEFTPEERCLYDRTTEYIRTEYNKALASKNGFHAFILIVYQKMLDSSSVTLLHTVSKRISFLRECLGNKEMLRREITRKKELQMLLEEAKEDEVLAEELVSQHLLEAEDDLRSECLALEEIHKYALGIKLNKKAEKLLMIVREILEKNPKEKIIIFTQFYRTLEYLKEVLSAYSMSLFHGGLGKEEKDRMVDDFRSKNTFFISTEAGGEGRNLQFARYLINYDLPWSPLKIEQRIGRIHRFGQKHDVRILNFTTKDTIGDKVLQILGTKIGVFDDSFGGSDTLLGYVEEEVDFDKTIMEFHIDPNAAEVELDKRVGIAKENFHYLEELTAHKVVDFNLDAFYQSTQKERSISNTLIEAMAREFCSLPDSTCKWEQGKEGSVHYSFEPKFRSVEGYFDSLLALKHPQKDFFAFGHPLIDQLSQEAQSPSFLGFTSHIVIEGLSAGGANEGILFNFVVDIRSSRLYQTMVPVFVDKESAISFEEEERITSEFLKFQFVEAEPTLFINYGKDEITGLFNKALLFLEFKIKSLLDKVRSDLELQVGKEIPAINRHYGRLLQELEDLLALQKSKEKMYNTSTLKGLMTRTENKIRQFKAQKEREMDRMRSIKDLRTSYRLLNCAYVTIR